MADVFVSYRREDEPRVANLVQVLERAGLGVFWDRRIPPGASWRHTIDRELDAARCVLVVWSRASVLPAGDFVHDEATRGKTRGVLLPVRIDDVAPPIGFGEVHAGDLIDWYGDVDDPRVAGVVSAVAAIVAGGAASSNDAASRPAPAPVRAARAGHAALHAVSGYLGDLLQLVSGPKRFLIDRTSRETCTADAVTFGFVTYGLANAVMLTLPRGTFAVTELLFDLGQLIIAGLATYAAWRIVGASVPIHPFLAIHVYIASVIRAAVAVTTLSLLGTLSLGDPQFLRDTIELVNSGEIIGRMIADPDQFLEQRAWIAASVLVGVAVGAMVLWFVIAWGAYRHLTGASRLRSVFALVLFGALCVPLTIIGALVANALTSL
jgi:hypothetical protein